MQKFSVPSAAKGITNLSSQDNPVYVGMESNTSRVAEKNVKGKKEEENVQGLKMEKEYRDRFKHTQTECQCKCRCKLKKKNFGQQVNFQFKFMEDVGVQFPKDLTEAVKDDHSYTQGGKKKKGGKGTNTNTNYVTVNDNLDKVATIPSVPPIPPIEDPGATLDFSVKRKSNDTSDDETPDKKLKSECSTEVGLHKSIAVSIN